MAFALLACASPDSGVGADVSGGGPTTSQPSSGATPGTPSESFGREAAKPKPK
jgi:hypothetical protein